jgi:hypothetical protein
MLRTWVSGEGGKGASPDRPRPEKNSMFSDFFLRKIVSFLFVSWEKKLVLAPGKKSVDAHGYVASLRDENESFHNKLDRFNITVKHSSLKQYS